jgi:hypothetical protein
LPNPVTLAGIVAHRRPNKTAAPEGPTDEVGALSPSAFTDSECDAVRDWVRGGGSLLLIADHAPFGATAAALASRFGVEMGKGYAWTVSNNSPQPSTTIAYSRQSRTLGDHAITRGITQVA